jgi:hypothetical protein
LLPELPLVSELPLVPELPLEPDEPPMPEEPLDEPVLPLGEVLLFFEPVAPFEMTSICVTWAVSPEPEKLART